MYHRDERPFIHYLAENARNSGDSIALFSDNCVYTWKECIGIVCEICKELRERWLIDAETGVTYMCENRPDDVLILFALLSIGCQLAVSITPMAAMEISRTTEDGDRRKCLIDTDELMHSVKKRRFGAKMPVGYDTTEAHIVLFTSGTESQPKGIVLQQYAVLNNALNLADCMGLRENDRICLIPRIHHCFGLLVLLTGVVSGAATYFPETRNYRLLLEKIRYNEITILNAVPTVFLGMCYDSEFQQTDVTTVRGGIIAGGMYSPSQFQDIATRFSMKLMSSYGLTECCATVTFCNLEEECSKHVGRFIQGVQGCIKDAKGETCAPECEGEICVKGYNLMSGIWSDCRFTPCPIDVEGWYHTGDLGYMDLTGRLHITGRLKNIVIRGGENISVAKLTEAALMHPKVLECVVVGISDEFYGELPCMAVRTTGEFDGSHLERHLEQVLFRYERPAKIAVLEEIPTNSNGKYDLKAVRRMFEEPAELKGEGG